MSRNKTEEIVSNRVALVKLGTQLIAAMTAFVELPSDGNHQRLIRLMFQYQTIYELCELP